MRSSRPRQRRAVPPKTLEALQTSAGPQHVVPTEEQHMATERPTPIGPASPDLAILESRVYRGPNIWSYEQAIHLVVDLGGLEDYPTNTIDGFTDHLLTCLPRLAGIRAHAASRAASWSVCVRAPGWGTWPSTCH